MDKEMIKEVIREMILNGEVELTTIYKQVYSNEGHYYGDEKTIVLKVETADGETKIQDYGVKMNHVRITGW